MADTAVSIPIVQFHEQVSRYFEGGVTPESAIMKYREMTQKYKIYESSIDQKLARLVLKINEINANLDAISVLKRVNNEPIEVDYELGETLYAKAVIADTQKVHLWIGTNTLREYSLEDASSYLKKKLDEATAAKELVEKDMKTLKEQITVCEVTTARIYNHIIASNKKREGNSSNQILQ
jgi:prefoldin subunit 5